MPANEPLLVLEFLLPCGWDLNPLIQWDLLCLTQVEYNNKKTMGVCAKKSFDKSPAPLVSRCWGSHRQLPPSGVTPSMATAWSASLFGCSLGLLGKGTLCGKKYQDRSPGLFLLAHSPGSYHLGHHVF